MKTIIIREVQKQRLQRFSNNASMHSDFICYEPLSPYFESKDYFFYSVHFYGRTREIRFWKKSKRVSVAGKFTPADNIVPFVLTDIRF